MAVEHGDGEHCHVGIFQMRAIEVEMTQYITPVP
jgi:hypothetical protein